MVLPLAFYVGCLAFGGILLAASAFGGGDGHSDVGDGADHAGDNGHQHHGHGAGWLPFLSLRFWTFALAFFGLTGSLLTGLGVGSGLLVPVLSGGLGIGAGWTASRLFQRLAINPVGLLSASPVGREGKLLLPIVPGKPGKLRLSVGGVSTDLIAEIDGGEALAAGTSVLIVALRGNIAVVERSPSALPTFPTEPSGSGPKETT